MSEDIAVVFGALLVSGILFGILSSIPALEKPGYLSRLSTLENRIILAAISQIFMATVYVGIAVLLFGVIEQHHRILAFGYFGFRIIGAAFLYLGVFPLLLLLPLGRNYATQTDPILAGLQTAGELLRNGRDLINHIGMILPWSLGGFILYFCFLRMGIVPHWISIWGLIATLSTLVSTFLLAAKYVRITGSIYLTMNIPSAVLELVFAGYLLFWA